jgi:hypothetical protein
LRGTKQSHNDTFLKILFFFIYFFREKASRDTGFFCAIKLNSLTFYSRNTI